MTAPVWCSANECAATADDLRETVAELALKNLLRGLDPRFPIPPDLVGVGPFWTVTPWSRQDLSCLDQQGHSRYGSYNGFHVCVSPELSQRLRQDVALHELGHVWQRNFDLQPPGDLVGIENDADCWARLHNAKWVTNDLGCLSGRAREDLLARFAYSLGLMPFE